MRLLESSVIDFDNVFHFGKNRQSALNDKFQITNLKQYTNPNIQILKQKTGREAVIDPVSKRTEVHDDCGQSRVCGWGNHLDIEEQGEKWNGDNNNAETGKPLIYTC